MTVYLTLPKVTTDMARVQDSQDCKDSALVGFGWEGLCKSMNSWYGIRRKTSQIQAPGTLQEPEKSKKLSASQKCVLSLLVFVGLLLGIATMLLIQFMSTAFRPAVAPGSITTRYCNSQLQNLAKDYRKELKTQPNSTATDGEEGADIQSKLDQIQTLMDSYSYNVEHCMNYRPEFGRIVCMALACCFLLLSFCVRLDKSGFWDDCLRQSIMFYLNAGSITNSIMNFTEGCSSETLSFQTE